MNWFLVESTIPRTRQNRLLEEAGIQHTPVEIYRPRNIKGIAFPEEKWDDVQKLFKLTGEYVSESTSISQVRLLRPAAVQVIVDDSNNLEYYEDELEPVLSDYALRYGVEIHISNPHGSVSEPLTEEGKLYIRIWSAPQIIDTCRLYRACGVLLARSQADAIPTSGRGVPLFDDDDNIVAEVVGGTLYILFDLPHGPNGGKLLKAILELYRFMQKSPGEREKRMRDIVARELQRSRKAYVEECEVRVKTNMERVKESIRTDEASITRAQEMITTYVRALDDDRRRLSQLEATSQEESTRFEQEFDKLVALHWVKKVAVKRGVISISTGQIDIPHDGVVYAIGKFRIDIQIDGRSGGVRCYNVTHPAGGYNHPHITSDGSCCFGNISSGVSTLIGQHEYAVLAQLLYQYLGTYNSGNPYHNIENWPVKTAEG